MDEGPDQVVSGDDSDETVPPHHGDTVDVILAHDLGRELERGVEREKDRRAGHRVAHVRLLEDTAEHLYVDAGVVRKTEHQEVEEPGHFGNPTGALQCPGDIPLTQDSDELSVLLHDR